MTQTSSDIDELLKENNERFVIFPLKYKDVYQFYKKAEAMIWSDDEIDLSHDQNHWKKIEPDEQIFLKHIFAFFAASDGIVMENLAIRFFNEVQIPEVRAFYSQQLFIENVHSITYSKIIDTIIQDPHERQYLFNAVQTMPAVAKKAEWALKWISSNESFATRLVAFAVVEGVFFSGSFSAIFWLRNRYRGLMPGIIQANELIMRDEGLHQAFAVFLYNNLNQERLSQEKINEIISGAVNVEIAFMSDALPKHLLGMNIELMTEHIQYVANRLAKQLGYNEIYPDVKQPFEFMTNLSITTVADFFGPSKETQYNIGDKFMGIPLELKESDIF
jgi:ribonucleotide reductase beta subunit family protein with ferritin-like domain